MTRPIHTIHTIETRRIRRRIGSLVIPLLSLLFLLSFPTRASSSTQDFAITCENPKYLDISTLTCASCGTNEAYSTELTRCICKVGYYLQSGTCTACPGGKTSSFDRAFCLSCPGSTNADGSCQCSTNEYLSDLDVNGTRKSTFDCVECAYGSYPSIDLSRCITCANGKVPVVDGSTYKCSCPSGTTESGDSCLTASMIAAVSSYSAVNAQKVSYKSVRVASGAITSMSANSNFFAHYFSGSVGKCSVDRDVEKCQLLGNLCALQLYDETTEVCKAYAKIAESRPGTTNAFIDWPEEMPWLYYGILSDESADVTLRKTLDLDVSFTTSPTSTEVNKLPFVVAKYSKEGEFLGLAPLGNELQLCSSNVQDPTAYLRFGKTHQESCKLDLTLLKKTLPETIFYDLYILQKTGDLYPVPIRMLNFRNTRGESPNVNYFPEDVNNDRLVRRFFLFDTISSSPITINENGVAVSTSNPEVIRFPQSITIRTTKQTGVAGKITIPVVDILYGERSAATLSDTDETELSKPTFTFQTVYAMDYSDFWRTITILFALTCMGIVVVWIYRSYMWSKQNYLPTDPVDMEYTLHVLSIAAGTLSSFFYVFLFLVSVYWLIFFKGQDAVYTLLPTESQDVSSFKSLLIATFICQTLYIIYTILKQCSTQLFFIDWEKPRGKLLLPSDINDPKPAPISVWRTLFIANEWHELQSYRRIHVWFNLVWMYFILEGCAVRYIATPQPDSTDLTRGSTNPLLLFAINAGVWMALIMVQLLYRFIYYDRFSKNKLLQFVDLLSISNLSLFVLDDRYHGYYIHGKTVHGYADTDIHELNENLKKEENDQVPRRGLNDTSDQMFEIFITRQLRDMYDKVYSLLVSDERRRSRYQNRQLDTMRQQRFKSNSEETLKAYDSVNKFLCGVVEKNFKEYQYTVRQKLFSHNFIPVTPDQTQGSVFFADESIPFASTLFYGMELQFHLLLILIYNLVDIYTDNSAVALLITGLFDVLFMWRRQVFGERNIAERTLVDRKFLT